MKRKNEWKKQHTHTLCKSSFVSTFISRTNFIFHWVYKFYAPKWALASITTFHYICTEYRYVWFCTVQQRFIHMSKRYYNLFICFAFLFICFTIRPKETGTHRQRQEKRTQNQCSSYYSRCSYSLYRIVAFKTLWIESATMFNAYLCNVSFVCVWRFRLDHCFYIVFGQHMNNKISDLLDLCYLHTARVHRLTIQYIRFDFSGSLILTFLTRFFFSLKLRNIS